MTLSLKLGHCRPLISSLFFMSLEGGFSYPLPKEKLGITMKTRSARSSRSQIERVFPRVHSVHFRSLDPSYGKFTRTVLGIDIGRP